MPMPAIILAAGASRRLGRPKQLVRIEDETLLGRTVRVVKDAGADPVFVVLGAHRESIVGDVDLTGVNAVFNPDWEEGIASSIRAGVVALRQELPDATPVLLLVCDQPRLTAEHLRGLVAAFDEGMEPAIVASAYAGIAGIPAIFPAREFEALLELRGDEGARSLMRDPRCPLVTVSFDGGEVDVDTPADLADAASEG
jgi:CTP:molybdopterin cytidylyltransferase MocA